MPLLHQLHLNWQVHINSVHHVTQPWKCRSLVQTKTDHLVVVRVDPTPVSLPKFVGFCEKSIQASLSCCRLLPLPLLGLLSFSFDDLKPALMLALFSCFTLGRRLTFYVVETAVRDLVEIEMRIQTFARIRRMFRVRGSLIELICLDLLQSSLLVSKSLRFVVKSCFGLFRATLFVFLFSNTLEHGDIWRGRIFQIHRTDINEWKQLFWRLLTSDHLANFFLFDPQNCVFSPRTFWLLRISSAIFTTLDAKVSQTILKRIYWFAILCVNAQV